MKNLWVILLAILLFSCGEKLLDKPEDLIPKDKMINILRDITILNSARSISVTVFHDQKIDPTTFVLSKYEVDSLQFVISDRYYASLPNEYEAMYVEVEKQLEQKEEHVSEAKKIKDSLDLERKLKQSKKMKDKLKRPMDSLP
ncbi:MAG: DUF4296 domain-containing protein [Maribacter sp.]|nr:DUF4296 domain-containing protein [Maribacter sp.]